MRLKGPGRQEKTVGFCQCRANLAVVFISGDFLLIRYVSKCVGPFPFGVTLDKYPGVCREEGCNALIFSVEKKND